MDPTFLSHNPLVSPPLMLVAEPKPDTVYGTSDPKIDKDTGKQLWLYEIMFPGPYGTHVHRFRAGAPDEPLAMFSPVSLVDPVVGFYLADGDKYMHRFYTRASTVVPARAPASAPATAATKASELGKAT